MAELKQFEFFLLRYAPNAVSEEFVNIGVVLVETGKAEGFADARFMHDWRRVRCLDPQVDTEMLEALEHDIRRHLLDIKDRAALLRKLEDSLSNAVRLSPTKACLSEDPAKEMDTLAELYFAGPMKLADRELSGRQRLLKSMRGAFEQANVWRLMRKEIPAAQYTHTGDPLKIDCGYRTKDVVKMFHAVSLPGGVDAAKVLAYGYPEIVEGIRKQEKASASLIAVVEDDLDDSDESIGFAVAIMEKSRIAVTTIGAMGGYAEQAMRELRA